MEIEKYNWLYRLNDRDLEVIPNIKDKKPEPETLYKYYSLNEFSVDALINNYIYASHPEQLNDPIDCYYKLIQLNDLDTIKSILKGVLEPNEIIKRWNADKVAFIQEVQFTYFHRSFIDLGIFSLTSDPLNILMWTYYSHNNGFVIQYDLQELKKSDSPREIVSGPFQINYQNEILPIKFDIKCIPLIFLYLTNIKANKWKHENEWRMIFGREKMYTPGVNIPDPLGELVNKRNFRITSKAIKKIILGHNFFYSKEYQKDSSPISIILQRSNDSKSFFLKKSVVDYIIENNIPSEIIGIDPNLFSLIIKKIGFKKTECDYKYLIV